MHLMRSVFAALTVWLAAVATDARTELDAALPPRAENDKKRSRPGTGKEAV